MIEERKILEDYVDDVDFDKLGSLSPTKFALNFINFIKLVNGGKGEENKSPVFHYDMLNQISNSNMNLFVAFRGSAKSSLIGEYMILYLALYGKLPTLNDICVGIYISDTIENGIKNMKNNLKSRYYNSEFLQKYIPKAKINENEWEFENIEGKKLYFKGFAAQTGFRGFKQYGRRPEICIFDDLLSDNNANSPTIIENIENIIYKAAIPALHPTRQVIMWTGTPFNKKDPLYKAVESGSWNIKAYPICEEFPCDISKFKGAWTDRFKYDFVFRTYDRMKRLGKLNVFNQEYMLRIVSDEDRLIQDNEIVFVNVKEIYENLKDYTFYITTDFAVSEKEQADYNVISVWTYTRNNGWILIDGMMERCNINDMIDRLFKFSSKYKPSSVVLEASGTQKGFVDIIEKEMINRQSYFPLYRRPGSKTAGVVSNISKLARFNTVVPLFKQKRLKFSDRLENTFFVTEGINQIKTVSTSGIKSAHDDFLDPISQLIYLTPYIKDKIPETEPTKKFDNRVYVDYNTIEESHTGFDSYL